MTTGILLLVAASIHGRVLDAKQRPVSGAVVHLETKSAPASEAAADAQGNYRFENLPAGAYSVRVEAVVLGPFTLAAEDRKQVTISLPPSQEPQFYDEPQFVVAGVTTGAYQGTHGSDVIVRSSDSLAKAAAALGRPSQPEDDVLKAALQFQRAAEADPSESHLFDWGSELLTHRANAQAIAVFGKGHRLYPHSVRTMLGLAAAYYAIGSYAEASRFFFAACDENPADPSPYLFLGQVQSAEIVESDGFLKRMERFAAQRPDDAQASYLYAKALWKHQSDPRPMLQNALRLNPRLAPAHLTLGILDASSRNFSSAIEHFEKAIAIDPDLEEAHYRLAQVYRQTGEADKARQELAVFEDLSRKSAAQSAIPRLVFKLKTPN